MTTHVKNLPEKRSLATYSKKFRAFGCQSTKQPSMDKNGKVTTKNVYKNR